MSLEQLEQDASVESKSIEPLSLAQAAGHVAVEEVRHADMGLVRIGPDRYHDYEEHHTVLLQDVA